MANGVKMPAIARKFATSHDACWRHKRKHLSAERRAQLVAGPVTFRELAEKASAEGLSLLDYLSMLRSTLFRQFMAATEVHDNQSTALLAGRLTEVLRLLAQVTGELSRATSTVNHNTLILASPLMADLQTMLAQRLRPHPEALRAVLDGLEELSNRAVPKIPALEAASVVG
jgi:hypothetical protein